MRRQSCSFGSEDKSSNAAQSFAGRGALSLTDNLRTSGNDFSISRFSAEWDKYESSCLVAHDETLELLGAWKKSPSSDELHPTPTSVDMEGSWRCSLMYSRPEGETRINATKSLCRLKVQFKDFKVNKSGSCIPATFTQHNGLNF